MTTMTTCLLTSLLAASLATAAGEEKGPPAAGDSTALNRKNPDLAAILKVAPKAPPLPKPTGKVVRVKTAGELYQAVKDAQPGTTIFLADGVYEMRTSLVISTDGLALRGASGDREKVILDRGGRSRGGCVMVAGGDDVLIADLTIHNSGTHGVHIQPHRGAQRTRIYNVKFHNIFVRHIKGSHPKYPHEPVGRHRDEILRKRPVGGEIRYCLFVNDRRKTNANDGFRGDYVGGIDMMWLKDWTIADNVFVGIRGRNGVGRGAIFIWVHSENVVAERNIIVNCDRGICFGNPSGSPVHMTGGIVRNNFIVTGASQGIEMCRTEDTLVAHNTVYTAGQTHPAAVQFHQHTKKARFVNNLVHGVVKLREGVAEKGNTVGDCAALLADPAAADLHLKPTAEAPKVERIREVPEDFDRHKRPAQTSPGGDQPK